MAVVAERVLCEMRGEHERAVHREASHEPSVCGGAGDVGDELPTRKQLEQNAENEGYRDEKPRTRVVPKVECLAQKQSGEGATRSGEWVPASRLRSGLPTAAHATVKAEQ